MLKVNRYLAEQEYEVQIDGETHKYQIAPEFTGRLRANLYFWENLAQNSIEGKLCIKRESFKVAIYLIQFRSITAAIDF